MDAYPVLIGALIFVLGASIGSFLNVVTYRYGSGSFLRSRSRCFSCGRELSARMLIPVGSYLFQRGRCAFCGARISFQYVLVEFVTGILFLLIAYKWELFAPSPPISSALFALGDAVVWSILVLITVYDGKHKIIPNLFSVLFALTALVLSSLGWLFDPSTAAYPWTDLFGGLLLALPFALLWFFSQGSWMGLGDAKLSVGIGWLLGFSQGLTALVFAFWIAFFPSLFLLLLRRKRYTMKSEVPLGPFLVLGTLVVYLFGFDITTWMF